MRDVDLAEVQVARKGVHFNGRDGYASEKFILRKLHGEFLASNRFTSRQ